MIFLLWLRIEYDMNMDMKCIYTSITNFNLTVYSEKKYEIDTVNTEIKSIEFDIIQDLNCYMAVKDTLYLVCKNEDVYICEKMLTLNSRIIDRIDLHSLGLIIVNGDDKSKIQLYNMIIYNLYDSNKWYDMAN